MEHHHLGRHAKDYTSISEIVRQACIKHFANDNPYESVAIAFNEGFYSADDPELSNKVARCLVNKIDIYGWNENLVEWMQVDWRRLDFTKDHDFGDGGDSIYRRQLRGQPQLVWSSISVLNEDVDKVFEIVRTDDE